MPRQSPGKIRREETVERRGTANELVMVKKHGQKRIRFAGQRLREGS